MSPDKELAVGMVVQDAAAPSSATGWSAGARRRHEQAGCPCRWRQQVDDAHFEIV